MEICQVRYYYYYNYIILLYCYYFVNLSDRDFGLVILKRAEHARHLLILFRHQNQFGTYLNG